MQDLIPLKGEVSWYIKTMLTRARQGDGLSSKVELQDEIGRGSNNRVFRAVFDNEHPITVRRPRRKSDTERPVYATCEFHNTLMASRLGVAPTLYDAWYVRHVKTEQRAGLHMVQQYFSYDLMDAFQQMPDEICEHRDRIGAAIDENIKLLANAGMLCYDLKPGNIVLSFDDDVEVKFIDFGREFCELQSGKLNGEKYPTPILDAIRVAARAYAKKNEMETADILRYLLYSTMTIILAAIITDTLYKNRAVLQADQVSRLALHCTRKYAEAVLDDTRGDLIKLVKTILRQEDIRDLLKHYVGKRNSGTKRIFRLARGEQV
jgi:hypothetical protein